MLILRFVITTLISSYGISPCSFSKTAIQTALGQQWSGLQPQHLTKDGEQIVRWLDDAASCMQGRDRKELDDRERVLLSDLLRCAQIKNTEDLGAACIEFARTHPAPQRLLKLLEPLIFARPPLGNVANNLGSFLPWKVIDGKLKLPARWLSAPFSPSSGPTLHFRILEQPLPKDPRADIDPFKKQIVDESSRWHI